MGVTQPKLVNMYYVYICINIYFLSKSMRYSLVINYYQTVIFYHNIKRRAVASWSDPMLAETVKGITNMETLPEDVKDPLTEKHLKIMFQYINVKNEVCVLFWTMIIFLFRTLLRVGHMVMSPHTLRRSDVEFSKWGVLISVNTSKTKQKGSSHKIPISKSENLDLCLVYWFRCLCKRYPRAETEFMFSTKNYPKLTYSRFNKSLKRLILASKI